MTSELQNQRRIMEEQGSSLSVETQETAAPTGPSSESPSVEHSHLMKTITDVFRHVLVQHLNNAAIVANFFQCDLGSRYSTILDASKRSRQEGVEELLRAIDEIPDEIKKREVAQKFMDSLKHTGNNFLHDVIIGKEKLDDNWELKNLLLQTEAKLLDVPLLELLTNLTCFDNFEREAIRSTEKNYGETVACSELFLRLQSKHPRIIDELIDVLRAIKYPNLAQSLEDAYKDRHKEQKSSGDPDGHDHNGDGGGPSQDPHDERKRPDDDDDSKPDDDKPESGSKPDANGAAGAAGGDDLFHDESGSGDTGRSSNGGECGDGSVPQMLQFLKLSDSSKTASSSTTSAAESKNTGKGNGARSCSAPMNIESLKLHDYQEELAEHALTGKNSVIVAPTGSGKTRVAVAIAIKALTEEKRKKRKRKQSYLCCE